MTSEPEQAAFAAWCYDANVDAVNDVMIRVKSQVRATVMESL
jgi:hypothetical protein